MNTATVLLHIPHSSVYVPKEVRESILLSDLELENELLRMTDRYTEVLFDLSPIGIRSIVFPVSRLVVDPERFENDDEEPMAKIGMGVIYTSTSSCGILRTQIEPLERETLLDLYYRPHHRNLTETVEKLLKSAGRALIIDCHSFSGKPWPYELNQDYDRPDICIGTDQYHTSDQLLDVTRKEFGSLGYSVKIDSPFSGSIVPLKHFRKERKVESIMIEVNRGLYMNEDTGEKNGNFLKLKKDIEKVLTQLCKQYSN